MEGWTRVISYTPFASFIGGTKKVKTDGTPVTKNKLNDRPQKGKTDIYI